MSARLLNVFVGVVAMSYDSLVMLIDWIEVNSILLVVLINTVFFVGYPHL